MGNSALILEGGGFRGTYTAGALDVLLEQGFGNAFDSVWGVSAGATNAATFKSGQIGRTIRDFLAFRDDPRFMSFISYVRTGNIAGAEFIYDEIMYRLDPFNVEAFNANPLRMMAVASDVTFGQAMYLPIVKLPEDTDKVRASASLPAVSEVVQIDGHRFLDGGTCDAVPVEVALGLSEGAGVPDDWDYADKAVVILTRERSYTKHAPSRMMRAAYQQLYAGFPYFLEQLENRHERYNKQRETIWELEAQGKLLVIAPNDPVALSVTETSGEKLLDLYIRGRNETLAQVEALRAFLAE